MPGERELGTENTVCRNRPTMTPGKNRELDVLTTPLSVSSKKLEYHVKSVSTPKISCRIQTLYYFYVLTWSKLQIFAHCIRKHGIRISRFGN